MNIQPEKWADNLRGHLRQVTGNTEDGGNTAGLNPVLRRVRFVLIAVLVLQGAWAGSAVLRTALDVNRMDQEHPAPPRSQPQEDSEKYKPILEKGILGVPPPPQPLQLFGVLGNRALLGDNPGKIQEYDVGGEVPGGEKIVEIGVESVTLEKDGASRTLTVFPELK